MLSVIIPAFNEEKVIARCLAALRDNSVPLEIIVVCNGCTDHTAEIALKADPKCKVLSIEKASKTEALNFGIEHCQYSDIVLMDADITFNATDLLKLAKFTKQNNYLLASPAAKLELTHASFPVKAYYKILEKLPYYQEHKISAVIYLSEEGKKRVAKIPELIADDTYISLLFNRNEKSVFRKLFYQLVVPANYRDLLKILTRSQLGNLELRHKHPLITKNNAHQKLKLTSLFPRNPFLIPATLVFIITKLIANIRAKRQFKVLNNYQWEKDESSRNVKNT